MFLQTLKGFDTSSITGSTQAASIAGRSSVCCMCQERLSMPSAFN